MMLDKGDYSSNSPFPFIIPEVKASLVLPHHIVMIEQKGPHYSKNLCLRGLVKCTFDFIKPLV